MNKAVIPNVEVEKDLMELCNQIETWSRGTLEVSVICNRILSHPNLPPSIRIDVDSVRGKLHSYLSDMNQTLNRLGLK